MRRDDRLDETNDSEITAIEKQWTDIWEAQGGPQGRVASILRRDEFHIMNPYIERLPKGARLLDGGCGMGDWVLYYTEKNYPTVGLDVSKLTIGKLQQKFPQNEFAVGDIRASGLASDSFDAYFSWGTFEHFEEGFGPVTQEAFRVLKPGGLLFVSTPFDNLRHSIRSVIWDTYRLTPYQQKVRFYQWRLTRSELANILAKAGFAVEEVHIIHKRQGLQRWLQHLVKLDPSHFLNKALATTLSPLLPATLIGHMILAVARKPMVS